MARVRGSIMLHCPRCDALFACVPPSIQIATWMVHTCKDGHSWVISEVDVELEVSIRKARRRLWILESKKGVRIG